MATKTYINKSVFQASKERVSKVFDDFDKYYISFSGGKDSTVMTHLVMDEAIKRGKKVGLLIIDLEAQYKHTIDHVREMVEMYKDHIELHWVCAEILLRNAVSDFQPKWCCWDEGCKPIWVREKPKEAVDLSRYDFLPVHCSAWLKTIALFLLSFPHTSNPHLLFSFFFSINEKVEEIYVLVERA